MTVGGASVPPTPRGVLMASKPKAATTKVRVLYPVAALALGLGGDELQVIPTEMAATLLVQGFAEVIEEPEPDEEEGD